jgi:hypothetical protein
LSAKLALYGDDAVDRSLSSEFCRFGPGQGGKACPRLVLKGYKAYPLRLTNRGVNPSVFVTRNNRGQCASLSKIYFSSRSIRFKASCLDLGRETERYVNGLFRGLVPTERNWARNWSNSSYWATNKLCQAVLERSKLPCYLNFLGFCELEP